MILGMIFRVYAMRTLGRFFTYQVAIQPGQTVVQSGPYRFIRHPSYTGGLITLLGLTITLGNWAGIAVVMTSMLIAYAYRIHVEEDALITALGDPYRQYMRHTTRLIPFLF
jgi:protein-S-isoprenylcysteine O-methyltransferase Ste14